MKLGMNTKNHKPKTQRKSQKNTTNPLAKSLTQRKCRKITKKDSETVRKQPYQIKITQNKEEKKKSYLRFKCLGKTLGLWFFEDSKHRNKERRGKGETLYSPLWRYQMALIFRSHLIKRCESRNPSNSHSEILCHDSSNFKKGEAVVLKYPVSVCHM